MKPSSVLNYALIFFMLFSCSKESEDEQFMKATACDQWVVIDDELYRNGPNSLLTINSVVLENNCLSINFSASGCSGETWEVELVDSGAIAESYPPQRFLRLSLKDREECAAYITKEISFDVSDLRFRDGGKVYLNIRDGESVLLE